MKRKRFSVEQIVAVLKQADLGMPVADLIRQVGISEQTYYRWKKQYAGMESDQVRELRTKRPRRRKMVVQREARCRPVRADEAWSLDFVHDQLSNGDKFRALTVVDVFTREALTIEVGQLALDVVPYALRHSSIVRGIRAGLPIRLVAALHDTSVAMIERHYARYIVDGLEELAARAVVPLVGAQPGATAASA